MMPLSPNEAESATKKCHKIHRTNLEISRKVIAFEEILSLQHVKRSERAVADLLKIPKSTMQSWRAGAHCETADQLVALLSTPFGITFLNRIVMAAYQVIHFSCGGIRGLQEFLQLSTLDNFVASSIGALHAFSIRCEEHIVAIGKNEEKRLAAQLKKRKITAALDEMFRGRHPCLVAIEVVSNYILLEKFTEDRKAKTWNNELKPRLEELNLELHQVVSDCGTGIKACSNELGAQHISELFHAQHELTKATAAPLMAQERESEANLTKAEAKLKKAIQKYGEGAEKAVTAATHLNLCKDNYDTTRQRRQKVSEAKKELGRIHHPIDLKTGALQTGEMVKSKFDSELNIIERCAEEAGLSGSSQKRLAKARKTFDSIADYVAYFFLLYAALIQDLGFSKDAESFFNKVVFPLSYLNMIWRRLKRIQKEELSLLKTNLEKKLQNAVYSEEFKRSLLKKGGDYAELFQRSSSCVEGRNGMLSLYYHRFHRLNLRSVKALTVVHNFHIRRSDGTTSAERLFQTQHENIFESLVVNVKIPSRPQKQHHDLKKRQEGWHKRSPAKKARIIS